MIEVVIDTEELKGIHHPDEYVQNKLRNAGIPISGFFNVKSNVKNGQLAKYTLTERLTKFLWSK